MRVGMVLWQKWHGRARGSIGSSIIRGEWIVDAWNEAEIWKNGQKFDAYIFQKVWKKDFIEDIKEPIIFDMCDPDWLKGEIKLKEVEQYADAITTSSESMSEFIRKVVKRIPVVTIEDRINFKFFPEPKKHEGKAKNVVWFGYSHNANEVLEQVLPSLKRLNLNLVVISNQDYKPLHNYGVLIRNVKWELESAYYNIRDYGDIAINPKSMKASFKYKSNNKTYISWALGVPVADSFDDMIKWIDEEPRKKEAEEKYNLVKKEHTVQKSIEQYKKLICQIIKAKK